MKAFRILGVVIVLAFTGIAAPAGAQERELEASSLPRDMVDRLVRIANDPATVRFDGPSEIPGDRVVRGNALVMGSLDLAGVVEGHLIVIEGDVDLRRGFEVGGDITVVGGELRGDDLGRIGGLASQFSRAVGGRPASPGTDASVSVPLGRDVERGASSHIALRLGDYNRVEGLQLLAGPVFTTGGNAPLRASALLVWRTEHDGRETLEPDRVGYRVEAEQFLGGGRTWRVGGGVHSVVSPIEAAGVSDRENAWGSVLFTSDSRDHLHRRGWNAFLRATPSWAPLDVRVGFEREEHESMAAADPWTLFGGDREWRSQPVVAEGSVRSISARVRLDTRDERSEPAEAWLVEGTVRRGVGGSLSFPGERIASVPSGWEMPVVDARFTTATADVRRYHAVGRGARLNLRAVAGGSLDGEALPAQYQHALGGIGSLPGHPHFAGDCGARGSVVAVDAVGSGPLMRPFYGCDRFALFQAEYRSPIRIRTGFGPPSVSESSRESRPSGPRWVAFFNAGRGWAAGNWGDFPRVDSGALYDAGLGLLVSGAGVYWAVPLGNDVGGSRWTVRLERRF